MKKVNFWMKVFEVLPIVLEDLKTACTSRRVVWKMIGVNTKKEELIAIQELGKAEARIEKRCE